MKNKISFTFLFTLLVVVGLLALHYLPPVKVNDKPLRKVDLLADLRPDIVEVADSDTVLLPPVVKPTFVDTCKTGITCIEDYSDSTMRGMTHFYEALTNRSTLNRPVRIAYFGDSFIEADILTGDLRAMFQNKFGGCGVGYVSVTSKIAGFRPTVLHSFDGWESHSVTDSTFFDDARQDLSNHYFIAGQGASVTLKGQRKYASRLDSCRISTFYFHTSDSLILSASINGGAPVSYHFSGAESIQAATVEGNIRNICWKVEKVDSVATFYGVTMDGEEGITLDNFSTRGSGGQQLGRIPMATLKAYNRLRTYDLIVLQYGLNVAFQEGKDYSYYKAPMAKVVNRLKEAFPEASILIVGIGDREYKDENGELRTMPGVKNLIRYQQALAAETHVAFWNLFQAMGGEGSMVEMVNSKPSMANYDYTHINFRGGKHIAGLLFEALMYGKEQHEKRKAYEAE